MKRVAVFISGQGSNLKALIDENPEVEFQVYANSSKAAGLAVAKRRGLFTKVLSLKESKDWDALASDLNFKKVSHILLLGFMKIIPASFLKEVKASLVNLHPSLLPAFTGLRAMERSFQAQESMGCSLHEVTAGLDEGPLLLQKEITKEQVLLFDFSVFKNLIQNFEQRLVKKYFSLRPGGF